MPGAIWFESVTESADQSESPTPPTTAQQKLRAWLELARISNLPTVWSNVLVGVSIAPLVWIPYKAVWENTPAADAADPWRMLELAWVPAVAVSLFYIAGMMLNDLFDLKIDRQERPDRPLPSGRVNPRAAAVVTALLFVIGWLLIAVFCSIGKDWGLWPKPPILLVTTLLIAAIVGYNWLHKKFAASIVMMGASRSLVYITAACTVPWSLSNTHPVWMLAVVLGLYTIGITVIARGETKDRIDQRKWLAVLMPIAGLAMIAVVRPPTLIWAASAGLALCFWLAPTFRYVFAKPPQTVKAVLTWLSGMCLVDAYFLTLLNQPILALIAGGCFLLTAWGHRHILGT